MNGAKRFAGKTAIVTGAGAGIGRATALRLGSEGARVIATDIVDARLESLANEWADDSLVTVAGDACDSEVVAAVVAHAHGRIDLLANVAGIADNCQPVAETDDLLWDRVIDVNLTAPFRLTRAVLPMMLEAGTGAIVMVSSVAGLRGSAAGAAYTASKHALIGLTRNLAFVYSPLGIRANAVCPGPVDSSIEFTWQSKLAKDRFESVWPVVMPPSVPASRIASCIAWLGSDDSANVTGAILPSDGGWTVM